MKLKTLMLDLHPSPGQGRAGQGRAGQGSRAAGQQGRSSRSGYVTATKIEKCNGPTSNLNFPEII